MQAGAQLDLPHDGGVAVTCACVDRTARIEHRGDVFSGHFNGSISALIGAPRASADGRQRLPLQVVGYTTTSDVSGLGRTTLDFDFSEPVAASHVDGGSAETFFPGSQTMNLRITMRLEHEPELLRATGPGTLVNRRLTAFPPPEGSRYVLERPVALASAERVVASMLEVNTEIVSTEFDPPRIAVGRGLVLLAPQAGWVATKRCDELAVRFELPATADAVVHVLDSTGTEVATVAHTARAGENVVPIDVAALGGARYDYRLELDGELRTATMPLVRGA